MFVKSSIEIREGTRLCLSVIKELLNCGYVRSVLKKIIQKAKEINL